nr:MAG TPA: tail completion protein [Caudoviricetes sp.]
MITEIENALVDRLTRGLGQLANTVKSYGGELDDESLGTGRLPMVLVTFGGARIEPMGVRGTAFRTSAKFVVIVAVRSLRSNQAARQGGVDKREVGANQLIYAVRRLLDTQRLGGLVKPLKPLAIRTLFNNAQFRTEKVTAYAIEYEAAFDDVTPLEDGLYPEKTQDPTNPDFVFTHYAAELSPVPPILEHVDGKLYDPNNNAEVGFSVKIKDKT